MKCDDSHSQIIKILLLDGLTSTSLALDWLARQPSSLHTDPGVFEEMSRKYGKYRQDRKVGSLSDGLKSQSGLLNQADTAAKRWVRFPGCRQDSFPEAIWNSISYTPCPNTQ